MERGASTRSQGSERATEDSFRHEALLYAGEDEFLAGTLPFIRDAVAAGEPILIVVSAAKIELLRAELGGDGDQVEFADIDRVGGNPARIIPAWQRFVDRHEGSGRRLRGIGEPIFPARSPAELVECHRHESLLNLAFADTPGFWLLCPYDTAALDSAVVDEAHRNHPFVAKGGAQRRSTGYDGIERATAPFSEPLPEPQAPAGEVAFQLGELKALRGFVGRRAIEAGMSGAVTEDLVSAVNEVATNSVRHGGGQGILRIWEEGDVLICEVRDGGRIDEPLVGRERPAADAIGGLGLWMANQLCDLVQVRSFSGGSIVRLHLRRR